MTPPVVSDPSGFVSYVGPAYTSLPSASSTH